MDPYEKAFKCWTFKTENMIPYDNYENIQSCFVFAQIKTKKKK